MWTLTSMAWLVPSPTVNFCEKTGEDAVVGIIGEPHDEAKYVLNRFHLEYPQTITNSDGFNEVILVDASDLNGLEGKISPEKVMEIIDHRKVHEADKFPQAKTHIELVGAAATLVAEKFVGNNVDISIESATLLYAAIISNTLNFKGSVTTNRDRSAAEWLHRMVELPENFWRDMFIAKSDLTGDKLVKRIESDFAWLVIGGKNVGIAQIEMIGAEELISKRSSEIIQKLEAIKTNMGLDFVFLNTIELDDTKNIFVTGDIKTKKLVEKVLGVQFTGDMAVRPRIVMRKQIVPLLRDELCR